MGFVYFLRRSYGDVKIGWASDVDRRVSQLRTELKDNLQLLGLFPGSHQSECLLHDRFAADRKDDEWFAPSAELAGVIADCNAGRFSDPAAAPGLPLSLLYDPHEGAWTAEDFCSVFRPLLSEMIDYHARGGHRLVAVDAVAAACGVSSGWLRKFVASAESIRSIQAHAAVNILAAYRSHQHQVRDDAVNAISLASVRQAEVERALAFLWPSSVPAPATAETTDLPLWRAANEEE